MRDTEFIQVSVQEMLLELREVCKCCESEQQDIPPFFRCLTNPWYKLEDETASACKLKKPVFI